MRWLLITSILLLSCISYGEIPTLNDLKKALIQNNIEIQAKHQEIKVYQSKSSIFQNIRLATSYNFETESPFYGVVVSIPINTITLRNKEIRLKEIELEQLIQEKEKELEQLYFTWCDYQDLLPIKEMEVKEKGGEVDRKRVLLNHERIDLWELAVSKKACQVSLYELNVLKRDIQEVENQIKRLVGLE